MKIQDRKVSGFRLSAVRLVIFAAVFVTALSLRADAAKEGWVKKKSKIYYYIAETKVSEEIPSISGEETEEPETVLVKAKGLTKIGKKTFYFNKKGVLQTGLIMMDDGLRYFAEEGKTGKIGAMKTGLTEVDGALYLFHKKTGIARTGKRKSGGKIYYFSKKTADFGQAVKNVWVKTGGKYYFFGKNGTLITKCWISQKYYVGADGARIKGWLKIGSNRYYLGSKGAKVTGFHKIGGKLYYFDEKGRMATNTTIEGYEIGADGVATARKKVLIIAGHGQGDPGAMSKWGEERNYTRRFAKLIYDRLVKDNKVAVDFYKKGSLNYDCYQQNKKTLSVGGANIADRITGQGSVKSKVLAAIRGNSNIPDYTDYDYILEVHFNATGAAAKNEDGDGHFGGAGFYINSYKSSYKVEKEILSRIVKTGFKQWGGGIFGSSTLFNARICQELGVNYGLLETAFIDDGDDMKFYTKNKSKMAKAVAQGIEKALAG